ncbi:hypothetical protein [Mycoplasma suis]|uniref:Uncharacterized protein n=1 Tax=Mycoplasma suis (strain Illinois) TaxID=768700 RepID=F0QQJ4_MYCSL|nr:hypothetical protein [Mycoplasma suis]ADX97764.1 hypothetical protein MSU_0220 [Mycoplasma suis str. Illinois]
MLGGLLTKKFMTSIFGIAGVAGGGGMGLTSLLMNNSGKFEFNVGPEVKSEKYSESAEDVERKGYKYARDSSRLAAVFIYREQEKSGEDESTYL